MSNEIMFLISGYMIIVLIIVGILAFYSLTDIFMKFFQDMDKYIKKVKRKRNESRRRKKMQDL